MVCMMVALVEREVQEVEELVLLEQQVLVLAVRQHQVRVVLAAVQLRLYRAVQAVAALGLVEVAQVLEAVQTVAMAPHHLQ